MKKRQLIAMLSCLAVGMIGFAGAYTTERARSESKQQQIEARLEEAEPEELAPTSSPVKPKETAPLPQEQPQEAAEEATETMAKQEPEETESEEVEETVAAVEPELHFAPENGLTWPLEGDVLMNYSMDHMVYFETLEQYQYNPATVIGGEVNSPVSVIANGTITDISTNEETGLTVTEDLGDGYTAIYGQLKEVTVEKGDTVEQGVTLGYVSEPTKYYSLEGSNLYFAMEKNHKPVNPLDYFE